MKMRWAVLGFLVGSIALFAVGGVAQGPILTYTLRPSQVTLPPGGATGIEVAVHNGSTYAADNIALSASVPQGLSTSPAQVDLEVLDPFKDGSLELTLAAADDLSPGTYTVDLQIVYTYCIDVSCFQIIDKLPLAVMVKRGAVSAGEPSTQRPSPWRWGIPVAAAVVLIAAIALWLFMRVRIPLYVALGLFIVGGLAYGVHLNQQEQAQGIAAVLCTSCVGIEQSTHEVPTLLPSTVAALRNLEENVHLIVFYAPWCHSCPYAEALVKEMAEVTPRLSYELVNVEENRALAAANRVIVSERTVVPAIVRGEGGTVLFGIEDLQSRLLKLLGVGS